LEAAPPPHEAAAGYLAEVGGYINRHLRRIVEEESHLALRPLLEYALLSEGKRVRPAIVILSAQAVGGTREAVTSLALSFELVHTATLIHDDIVDEDVIRRNLPTLRQKWSEDAAVVVGDALIALAIGLAADYGPSIMKTVSRYALQICDGEYMDTSLTLDGSTEELCLEKMRRKSASLFRASAHTAALVVGAPAEEAEALAGYGENFGLAYQISDDLAELLGSPVPSDLVNRRVTLPIIHLRRNGGEEARGLLEKSFGTCDPGTVRLLVDSMKRVGSLGYCEEAIASYVEKARSHLKQIRESRYRDLLYDLPAVVVSEKR